MKYDFSKLVILIWQSDTKSMQCIEATEQKNTEEHLFK